MVLSKKISVKRMRVLGASILFCERQFATRMGSYTPMRYTEMQAVCIRFIFFFPSKTRIFGVQNWFRNFQKKKKNWSSFLAFFHS